MRPKERIPIFLKLVDFNKLEDKWEINISQDLRGIILSEKVIDYWLENPDQRFGQILINLGLIADDLIIWINEENDILIEQGIDPKEFLLWGINYDKDKNSLSETQWKLCKDLESDHIQKILEEVEEELYNIPNIFKETFKDILIQRNIPILDEEDIIEVEN